MRHISGKINVKAIPVLFQKMVGKRKEAWNLKPSAMSSERLKGDSSVDEPSYEQMH